MPVRAVLALLLIAAFLFAWRAWKPLPTLAHIAAIVAAILALPLLSSPGTLAAALLTAWFVSRFTRSGK